jgi:hypothetical protein
MAQLPGRAWGQDLHEVLAQGQPNDPEEEETVSVRVLGFLPPLLFPPTVATFVRPRDSLRARTTP